MTTPHTQNKHRRHQEHGAGSPLPDIARNPTTNANPNPARRRRPNLSDGGHPNHRRQPQIRTHPAPRTNNPRQKKETNLVHAIFRSLH